jgi:hypothetical protein
MKKTISDCITELEQLRMSTYKKIEDIETSYLKEVNNKITYALSEVKLEIYKENDSFVIIKGACMSW